MYVSIMMNEWMGVYSCMNMCIVLCGCVRLWECVGEMWMNHLNVWILKYNNMDRYLNHNEK